MENEQLKLINVIEEICTQKDICLQPMRLAQDIMNTDVKTLTLDHTVKHCLKFMEVHRIRHVPVVDLPYEGEQKPHFIGVVSQRDVLRLNAPDAKENDKQKIDCRALRQLLVQIVARKPKYVSLQTPIPDATTVMINNHIDMVPVLDNGDLAGIITTTDLMKFFFRLEKVVHELCAELKKGPPSVDMAFESSAEAKILLSWASRDVREIMTNQVICLEPQDNIAKAIEVLQSEEFRHIPIMNEQGKFVGLISDRDILRHLPFAGRRPLSLPKRFREHLFATDSGTKSLQLPLMRIMVRKVLHILPNCKVCEAVDMLYSKKVSCLPVVDKQERLQGIVTITDLMRALVAVYEPAEEAGLIPSESGIG